MQSKHCEGTFSDYCGCPDGYKKTTEKHSANRKECHQCILEDSKDDGETCDTDTDCGTNACKIADNGDENDDDKEGIDKKVCCDSTGQGNDCDGCSPYTGECTSCRNTHDFDTSSGTCSAKGDDGSTCDGDGDGSECYHNRCEFEYPDDATNTDAACCSAKGNTDGCIACAADTGDCQQCNPGENGTVSDYLLSDGMCVLKWVLKDEDNNKHENCTCNGDLVDLDDDHDYGGPSCKSEVGGRAFCFTDKGACITERIPVNADGVVDTHNFGTVPPLQHTLLI
jgi:hypothetical protein